MPRDMITFGNRWRIEGVSNKRLRKVYCNKPYAKPRSKKAIDIGVTMQRSYSRFTAVNQTVKSKSYKGQPCANCYHGIGTNTGVLLCDVVPLPSCPSALYPQQ